MIKRTLFAAPAALAMMGAAPLAAQDEAADEVVMIEDDGDMDGDEGGDAASAAMMGGFGSLFGELFKVEPLTDEQTARLPLAQTVAMKMMPEGALADIVTDMMGRFIEPITAMAPSPATDTARRGLGISRFELEDVSEENVAEIAAVFDPSYAERRKREEEALPKILAEVMSIMEPSIRTAMAEVFAVNFEAGELTQLDGFFSTAVGSKFARESYKMAVDPRILGASMKAVPQVMPKLNDLKKVMEDATADLPAKRTFEELSAAEKAKVAELSGKSVEELEENWSYSAEDAAEDADAAMEAAEE